VTADREPPARTGPHEALRLDLVDSPVGRLLVGASAAAVHLLEFTDPDNEQARLDAARLRFVVAGTPRSLTSASGAFPAPSSAATLLAQTRRQLDEYFAGQRKAFDLPLQYSGSPFQERVWAGLLTIGYGETLSYLDLARRLGDEKSLRAVGQANGQNPIAIVIPCHRVINASGDLGGFGGGPARKRFLLELESREQRGQISLL
jgi:O-6-methylguanine DNA methyltransferase